MIGIQTSLSFILYII